MTLSQYELLFEARQSLRGARIMYEQGLFGYAASRAYYTMLHVASAFLQRENLSFSSHSAVISAFGREFCKTGKIDPVFHEYLRKAFDARNMGDYPTEPSQVSEAMAKEQIERAEKFLELGIKEFGELSEGYEDD